MKPVEVPHFDDIDAFLYPLFTQVYERKSIIRIIPKYTGKLTKAKKPDKRSKEYKSLKPFSEFEVFYRGQSKSSAYQNFRSKFFEDGSDGAPVLQEGMTLRINFPRKLVRDQLIQAFREGEQHCVFTPLLAKWSEPAKSTSTQKYNEQVLKRIRKLADSYGDKPVPQEDMEDLAKKTETTFRIRDPVGNDYLTYNIGARKTIYLQNSRLNHVDESTETKPIEEITHEEAIQRATNLSDGEILEGSSIDPIRIHTSTTIYQTINPMKPALNEINDLIPDIKFDATRYPEINDFVLESRIINSGTLRFQEEYDEHYDLEKAYTQFHQTKYYRGFLGVIHQWRSFTFPPTETFLKAHNGIYKARIISPSPLAKLLGFLPNKDYILPLPEWTFHKNNGTTFVILQGVFGSNFDFRFPESSLKETGMRTKTNKPFRIFAGQLSSKINQHDTKTFNVKSTEHFAKHLASLYEDVFYDHESNLAKITIKHKRVFTKHHLFSFITSYTRIVMMEEMLKFDISNLSAVTLDGLYFKGTAPKNLIPQFRPKKSTMPISTSHLWYIPTENTTIFPLITNFNQNTFLEGAGGSGKTHTILNDKGFNTILYASPTHDLGKDKVKEYNLKHYTTIHRLIGEQCRSYKEEYGNPSVIFVDEITQIESSFITRLIALYPDSLIFIAGDVDAEGRHFQCKYSNQIWKPTFPIIQFTNDYRAKTQTLKEMKHTLRDYMKTDPTAYEIKQYVKKTFPTITKDQAIKNFKDDVWIAGTHKYIKEIPHKVHTTHSYQGKTIKFPTKLYISIDDMFEHTMFYTAMSRVESHEQLIIVID